MTKVSGGDDKDLGGAAAAAARALQAQGETALRAPDASPEQKRAALAAVGQKLWQVGFELRDKDAGQIAAPVRRTYERLASLAASVDRSLAPAIADAFQNAADDPARTTLQTEEKAAIAAGRKRLHGPEGEQRQRLVDRYVRSVDESGPRASAVLEADVPAWALDDVLQGLAALFPDVEVLVRRAPGQPAAWALRRGMVLSLAP